MWPRLIFSVFALIVITSSFALAQTIDPHGIFEERCSRCHTEHGGEFSRKTLVIQPNGQMVGRKSGTPVVEFLQTHSGSPTREEIAALIEMFTIQVRSDGLYKDKCGICHTSAKRLARVRLEVRGDKLVDRVTGRDVTEFLKGHGRLDASEVNTIDRMLRWQLKTAAP